jgi:hypothetical protein
MCCILFAVSACVRQPTYAPYPILTSASLSQNVENLSFSNTAGDSIQVTLGFTDGEGGIGPNQLSQDPDYWVLCNHAYDSILMADPFWNVYYYSYHASHISTDSCLTPIETAYVPDNSGSNLSLKGTIQFNLSVSCPPTGNTDTLTYSFFIKDRNGKLSNRIRAASVIVTCQ